MFLSQYTPEGGPPWWSNCLRRRSGRDFILHLPGLTLIAALYVSRRTQRPRGRLPRVGVFVYDLPNLVLPFTFPIDFHTVSDELGPVETRFALSGLIEQVR